MLKFNDCLLRFFQAIDDDERGTANSEVLYSLQPNPPWASHFSIDDNSGVLRVLSAVDYEAVTGGAISLTVIATDRGHPALSGSVNVTVTVQVSVFAIDELIDFTFKKKKSKTKMTASVLGNKSKHTSG